MGLKHQFHSVKVDPADPTIIGATKWNADHYYVDAAGAPIGNVGAVLLAGAAGALTHLNSVAAGAFLVSAGVGVLPAWASSLTALNIAGNITAENFYGSLPTTEFGAGGGGDFYWQGRSRLWAPNDGVIKLTNNANNDFSLLQFGGTTAAFPALKRVSNQIHVRSADDAQYATMVANAIQSSGGYVGLDVTGAVAIIRGAGTPEGAVASGVGSLFLRSDGGASTTLYVKQSGAATNTGWVAK